MQNLCSFSKIRLYFEQKVWENVQDKCFPESVCDSSEKAFMQAGQWNRSSELLPYKSTQYRGAVRKSQDITGTTRLVRKHIWHWTNQINPGSDTRKVTASNFGHVFSTIPSIPGYCCDFLTFWMNTKPYLETACLVLSQSRTVILISWILQI